MRIANIHQHPMRWHSPEQEHAPQDIVSLAIATIEWAGPALSGINIGGAICVCGEPKGYEIDRR